MKFRSRHRDEPEINLIAFIDVLLVVLIFLMLSTTFAQQTALQVNLPQAGGAPPKSLPLEVVVGVSADGRYAVAGAPLPPQADVNALTAALREASQGRQEVQVVVHADALAAHQRVMNVLDAARQAGLVRVAFAAQQAPK
jgi:biopolymer transport protein ExbD